MIYGYKEILDDLVEKYEQLTDEKLWSESETYKRFESVASELFALSCLENKTMKQAFAETASGEYLDFHARLKGITRKPASYARGKLKFYINEPSQENIIIPKSTVCSLEDSPFIQFSTDEQAVIPAGETYVFCDATAMKSGRSHNVKSGTVCVMVNAPVAVSGVTNVDEMSGGKDEESDSRLRQRIMSHYQIQQNGVNASSIENLIMKLDYIRDCTVIDSQVKGVMRVYVATNDDMLDSEQEEEIASCVSINRLFGARVAVILAHPKSFDLSVELHIKSGYEKENIEQKVYDALRDACLGVRIGDEIPFTALASAISDIKGIEKYIFSSPQAIGSAVYCYSYEQLLLGELAVEVIE